MEELGSIPRWIVESDPSWQKSIDSNPEIQKWTKKGTNIQAVCSPTSTSCEIICDTTSADILPNPLYNFIKHNKNDVLAGVNLIKYLSSTYLNPSISDSPRFDITRSNFIKSHRLGSKLRLD
ncbi:MAG: hypothetical protein JO327_13090 [Nitrososphaeraceae archaeon]|nr:hypothetical protein [Nitrososphaeraceae archaeon]MBV9669051.1 hypothetical protein [Nitrososphaeraceae archaeon]